MLVVSAHWLTPEQTLVDTQLKPKTIHDFGGFPPALFDVQYPAPGHPELARSAIAALAQSGARPSEEWGLDHGTWSVLRLLYPAADVPTFQVSIDYSKPPRFHWALGQALAALRTQGVLIIGSGNIVRNLRATDRSGRETDEASQPWAAQFDRYVQTVLAQRDTEALLRPQLSDAVVSTAVPTPDHYFLQLLKSVQRETALPHRHPGLRAAFAAAWESKTPFWAQARRPANLSAQQAFALAAQHKWEAGQ